MNKKYNRNTYKFVRFSGKIVRNKTQKNPLESLGKIPALIYDKATDKVLHRASINTVKAMGYQRGENPVLGSIGYNVMRIIYGLLAFAIVSMIINMF
jgi:hypothetical protein